MSSTMKASIHLGANSTENFKVHKKFVEIQNLFNVTQKLVLEHDLPHGRDRQCLMIK